MKVATAIAQLLAQHVKHAFVVSGGANLHLLHSIAETSGIDFICLQHEQACSFAADAYARMTGMGCAIATSGPGVINLLGGVSAAYYDSIPCVFIGGQVTAARRGIGLGVRQFGFQAMPNVELTRHITKYSVEVSEPENAIPELEKCLRIAKEGRPGPCFYSICDDVQRAEI